MKNTTDIKNTIAKAIQHDLIDQIVNSIGTKKFAIFLTTFIFGYMILNCVLDHFLHKAFDPAPFLFLNTCISIFSVYTYTFVAIHDKNSEEPKNSQIIEQNEKIIALLEEIKLKSQ